MERQIFINEMQARFNLRKPRSEKPTNLYLVCRINNKQVKLSTGVKIYPDHWNEKRQEAYISVRLSEIDNINNTCLLYTSPSPRDMRRSRMPSSA